MIDSRSLEVLRHLLQKASISPPEMHNEDEVSDACLRVLEYSDYYAGIGNSLTANNKVIFREITLDESVRNTIKLADWLEPQDMIRWLEQIDVADQIRDWMRKSLDTHG